MDIEVGDIIRLREDLKVGKIYGSYRFYNPMEGMQGGLFEVEEIHGNEFSLKDENYFICSSMIQEVIKRDPQPQKEYRMELNDSDGDTLKAQEMIAVFKDVEFEGEEKDEAFYIDIPNSDFEELTEMPLNMMIEIFKSYKEVCGKEEAISRFEDIISRFIEETEEIPAPFFIDVIEDIIKN